MKNQKKKKTPKFIFTKLCRFFAATDTAAVAVVFTSCIIYSVNIYTLYVCLMRKKKTHCQRNESEDGIKQNNNKRPNEISKERNQPEYRTENGIIWKPEGNGQERKRETKQPMNTKNAP